MRVFSERSRLRKTATKAAEFSSPNRSTLTFYIIKTLNVPTEADFACYCTLNWSSMYINLMPRFVMIVRRFRLTTNQASLSKPYLVSQTSLEDSSHCCNTFSFDSKTVQSILKFYFIKAVRRVKPSSSKPSPSMNPWR